jgi:hypothetical protein
VDAARAAARRDRTDILIVRPDGSIATVPLNVDEQSMSVAPAAAGAPLKAASSVIQSGTSLSQNMELIVSPAFSSKHEGRLGAG